MKKTIVCCDICGKEGAENRTVLLAHTRTCEGYLLKKPGFVSKQIDICFDCAMKATNLTELYKIEIDPKWREPFETQKDEK